MKKLKGLKIKPYYETMAIKLAKREKDIYWSKLWKLMIE